ncbi:MAG: hypothetical protein QG636_694 [Patescibacteria group bacterium]|nr:hypothetical protein [Patescibacteria group bacterium]
MDSIADTLICGSAEINRMRSEIDLVTQMLFGLAKVPRNSRRWEEIRPKHHHGLIDFSISFGDFETVGVVWEVWWFSGEDKFRTQCLLQTSSQDDCRCAYRTRMQSVHRDFHPTYGDLGVAGIQKARETLDVFVDGMLQEFGLNTATKPFIDAARMRKE